MRQRGTCYEARNEEDKQSQDKVGEQGLGRRSQEPGDQGLELTCSRGRTGAAGWGSGDLRAVGLSEGGSLYSTPDDGSTWESRPCVLWPDLPIFGETLDTWIFK